MVTFELNEGATLTDRERRLLAEAKKKPVVYDEDSPQMDDEMKQAFLMARKKKPYRGEPITVYVSPATIEKVKCMGTDYVAILGKLLDRAVDEYRVI